MRLRPILARELSSLAKPATWFPYGEAGFKQLRTDQQYYRDVTPYIQTMEELGEKLLLFRPPRWGKTLWCRTLEQYYCVKGDRTLFDGLHMGVKENQTKEMGTHLVLFMDFSINVSGDSLKVERTLYDEINGSVKDFNAKYADVLATPVEIEENAMESLRNVKRAADANNHPLYVIIDEYDRFANKLLLENRSAYDAMAVQKSGEKGVRWTLCCALCWRR